MLHTENRLRKGECSVSSFSTFIPEPALLFSRSSRLSSSGDLPDPGWPIGRRRVERQKVAQLVRPPSPDRHSDSGAKRDSGVKIGSGRRQTPRSTWGADNLDRSRLPPPPPPPALLCAPYSVHIHIHPTCTIFKCIPIVENPVLPFVTHRYPF